MPGRDQLEVGLLERVDGEADRADVSVQPSQLSEGPQVALQVAGAVAAHPATTVVRLAPTPGRPPLGRRDRGAELAGGSWGLTGRVVAENGSGRRGAADQP